MRKEVGMAFKAALSLALVLGLALSLGACLSPGQAKTAAPPALASEVKISILQTNDVHSRVEASASELGYERIATIANMTRAENPNTILVDSGDTLHGLPIANLERGMSVVRLLNAIGYDYFSPGNHDFNYGQERLIELSKGLTAKTLSANVLKNGKALFTPYDIREIGGLRLGFFGLSTPETAYKTDPKNVAGLDFADPLAVAKQTVAAMRGKVDLIICVAHLGLDGSSEVTSQMVALACPEIDVILDGHSHTSLEDAAKENKSTALIVSSGNYAQSASIVEILFGKDRSVLSKSARAVSLKANPSLASDPIIKSLVAELKAAQEPELAIKVGSTAVKLEGTRNVVRSSQSNLGTVLASAMLWATQADAAIWNGGGIRDSIQIGDISKKSVFTVMPFGNYAMTIELSGADLKAALENGVSKLPDPDGRFPQVAGLSFTIDAAKPAGERLSAIMVGGAALDLSKNYVLAVPNFLASGGDGYTALKGKKLVNEFSSDAEIFIAYLNFLGGQINAENIGKIR